MVVAAAFGAGSSIGETAGEIVGLPATALKKAGHMLPLVTTERNPSYTAFVRVHAVLTAERRKAGA